MAEIGVIGSGSWGTALALVLNKNGHHVTIWSYLKEEAVKREVRFHPCILSKKEIAGLCNLLSVTETKDNEKSHVPLRLET